MNQLQLIEQSDQRVLTTAQLAEAFGTEARRIAENFNANKERYKLGKHYFLLEGETLKGFKNEYGNSVVASTANKLYLWTEKGACLHAKSLNTDPAWETYERLVDEYYEIKYQTIDTSQLSPELQMFKQIWDGLAKSQIENARMNQQLSETTKKVEEVENAVTVITETMIQRDEDWRKSINHMINAAARRLGGKYQDLRNESYRLLEERAHCKLSIRLTNLIDRLQESGATKAKINSTTKMDVIESDARLKEIYTVIVKELSIGSLTIKSS